MKELVREIVEEDIHTIKELLCIVFGNGAFMRIKRLGGLTNRSYKVTRNDFLEYLVRIPGEGTEHMINRLDEKKSTELACDLCIDSELLYFDEDGKKVMRFIKDPLPMNEAVMRKPENIQQAAKIFRKLHSCGKDTGVRFEVFEMASLYEQLILDANVCLYEDYSEIKKEVMEIKAAVDTTEKSSRVPCHNDCLVGNWVLDHTGRLYLIDWEYSGMNEAMWDLSCLSIEAEYTEENDVELLNAYWNREATLDEWKSFVAHKVYVDYLWSLWGLTRVPFDGVFMQTYANTRYKRLKQHIEEYKKL